MCGYWGSAPPSQVRFLKVGPFLETIFQANFRSWLKIWNFQLLGCVNPEKLSFLERWLFVCGYWGSAPLSQIRFSKVGPFLETVFQANFRSWLKIWNFQLLGCVNPEKLSFLERWLFVCGYWGSAPASQVPLSKVGPVLDLAWQGQNFEMPQSHLSGLKGCVNPKKLSF